MIDKCAEYIKEVKLTNNPRLWLEVAIIDLANLTENTSLVELQNRIARLEGGAVQPVKVATYKTAPSPVMKPEIGHAKPDIAMQKEVEKAQPTSTKPVSQAPTHISKTTVQNVQAAPQPQNTSEDFSPMPKSKPLDSGDISVLWGQLLTLIQSPPTRALLKQWANPIKIEPDETVLSMKNEIFLNQVQSGSKKQAIIEALDSLFGQSNSNVVVRLPHPDDTQVKPSAISAQPVRQSQPKPQLNPSPVMKPVEKTSEIGSEEVEELREEVAKPVKIDSASKIEASLHSDNVNMVMELFDGKVIE